MAESVGKTGILLIDKAPGLTSFSALGICKKSFGTKRIGHTGTLDSFAEGLLLVCISDATRLVPYFVGMNKSYIATVVFGTETDTLDSFAEGLLLVCISDATRLVPYFVGMNKSYIATVVFGTETDTLDPGGKVIAEAPVPPLERIEASLPSFFGDILQKPPVFSAIHINGKRAYERTLAGEDVEMPLRPVQIQRLEILSWNPPELVLQVDCSSGTYIRSLARDIAYAAGSCAHLKALRRTRIGQFRLENAVRPPAHFDGEPWWADALLNGVELARTIPGLHIAELSSSKEVDFRNGKALSDAAFSMLFNSTIGDLAVCCDSRFLGVVKRSGIDTYSYSTVFANPL